MPVGDEVARMKVRNPEIAWDAPGMRFAPSQRPEAARRTRDDLVLFGMLAIYAIGAIVIGWFLLAP